MRPADGALARGWRGALLRGADDRDGVTEGRWRLVLLAGLLAAAAGRRTFAAGAVDCRLLALVARRELVARPELNWPAAATWRCSRRWTVAVVSCRRVRVGDVVADCRELVLPLVAVPRSRKRIASRVVWSLLRDGEVRVVRPVSFRRFVLTVAGLARLSRNSIVLRSRSADVLLRAEPLLRVAVVASLRRSTVLVVSLPRKRSRRVTV